MGGRGTDMDQAVFADAARRIASTGPIYVAGCTGEPAALLDTLEADPDILPGRVFTGVWIPGVNRRDPTRFGRDARALSIFATPETASAVDAGRIGLMPMSYCRTWEWLSGPAGVAGGLLQVSPPERGEVSLGLAADFSLAIAGQGVPLVGQINPAMPFVARAPRLPVERFAALIEAETPLPTYDTGPVSEVQRRIAGHVLAELRPGDRVQLGLGKVQNAIVEGLSADAPVAIHSGMISTPIADAMARGAVAGGVTTGVALGSEALYRAPELRDAVTFAPVRATHDIRMLSALANFVSVNSVLEMDLWGQATAEFAGGRQISGQGGLVDFASGATASPGGRSILAFQATRARGTLSRIVATLPEGVPVTVPRALADIVVTEYGVARLRHLTGSARAAALIDIAAPEHRDALGRAWEALNQRKGKP